MLKSSPVKPWRLLLAALPLLLVACGASLPVSPPAPVQRAKIPALPLSARQPSPPSQCLPTCSDGAASDAQNWADSLTLPASPGKYASGPTTP